MQKRFAIAALAITAILITAVVLAALQSTKTITSTGSVYAFKVGVYTDETCTTAVNDISWPNLLPGEWATEDVYVRNDAETLSMTLSMSTTAWTANPSNSTYDIASLTWNATSTTLAFTEGVWARLNLTIFDNPESQAGLDFGMNINIIGDQV